MVCDFCSAAFHMDCMSPATRKAADGDGQWRCQLHHEAPQWQGAWQVRAHAELNEAATAVGAQLKNGWGRDGLECNVDGASLWPFIGYDNTVGAYDEAEQRTHTLRVYPDSTDGALFQPLNTSLRSKWDAWGRLCRSAERIASELSGERVSVQDAQMLRISPQTACGSVFKPHTDNHNPGDATARFSMDVMLSHTPPWAAALRMRLEKHRPVEFGRQCGDALLFRAMAPHETVDTQPLRRVNKRDRGKTLAVQGGVMTIDGKERHLCGLPAPFDTDGSWKITAVEDKAGGKVTLKDGPCFGNGDEWEHMKVTLFLGGDGKGPPRRRTHAHGLHEVRHACAGTFAPDTCPG